MELVPLCTLELRFDDGMHQVRTDHGDGAIYGTGSGSVTGEGMRGRLHWTNHPRIRADGTTLPDLHGVLELDDGTTLLLEMTGVSTLLQDGVRRDTRGMVSFTAPDGPYAWLNDAFCLCEGDYDDHTERGRFVIHVSRTEPTG